MESLLQGFAVGLIVLSCAVFAAWRLTPAGAKLKMLNAVHADASHFWGRWVARLRKSVREELTHGCGGCSQSKSHLRKR